MHAPPPSFALLLCGLLLAAGGNSLTPEYSVARRQAIGAQPPAAAEWDEAVAIRFGPDRYITTFRALWNDAGMWLRFDAVDPAPWHTMSERDAPLWEEEVVEIFIDPDGDGRDYVEIEISPANVVTDLLMFRGDPGKRSDIDWDFDGLETSVQPLAAPAAGWSAFAFLPWRGFASIPGIPAAGIPAPGDSWRFNLFRIKRPGGPADPESGAVYAAWSPPPGFSFHVPEVFGTMIFEQETR